MYSTQESFEIKWLVKVSLLSHLIGRVETYIIHNMTVKKVNPAKTQSYYEAYKDFLTSVKKKKLKITTAKTGVEIYTKASNISLKFIAPVKSYAKSDLNNWSGVLLLKHGKKILVYWRC